MSGFIYGLADPRTEEIRYVGRSVANPWGRYLIHTRETSDTHKCRWIKTLKAAGLMPKLVIIEMDVPIERINERECWWIAAGRSWGWGLTNGTRGGDGLVAPSQEVLEKMSKARRARAPMSAETRAKLSKAHKGRKYTPEAKAAVSAGIRRRYAENDELRKKRSEQMTRLWAERRKEKTL